MGLDLLAFRIFEKDRFRKIFATFLQITTHTNIISFASPSGPGAQL